MNTETTHIKTEKQLIPALRLKDFNDEWTILELGEMVKVIDPHPSHRAPKAVENGIPFIGIGDINSEGKVNFKNVRLVSKEIYAEHRKRYIIEKGDFAYGRVASIGKVAELTANKDKLYTYSPTLAIIKPFAIDSSFVKFCMNSEDFISKVGSKTSGSTRKSLGIQNLRLIEIIFPTLPEQQKIASFLSAVDEKIQQLTKKKVLLEQYKKGSLQQLFSGQLRFKDENGKPYPDWEETKLVECILRNEKSKIQVNEISGNVKNKENKFPFFTSGEKVFYSDNYLIENENIFMSTGGKATVQFFKGRCSYSTDTFSFSSNSDNSTGFIFYFLENIILKIENQYFYGSGLKHLDKKGIMKYKLLAPSQPEQQKIAAYLSSIDTKIEAVNNQITQTQTFKKGLLQQMFV